MENNHVKIMLIGESYGEQEEREGKPFVGLAGKCLDGILHEAGLRREDLYITNVINRRPPHNNFQVFYEGKEPTQELREAYDILRVDIDRVKPNVVVCLGNEALQAVMGHKGIMDWRGSVLQSPQGYKVVPTIHPASVLREWRYRPAVVTDFRRIKEEGEYAEIKRVERRIEVIYDTDKAIAYVEGLKGKECAFDIETESGQVTCIGFSSALFHGVCIPFWFGSSGSLRSAEDETRLWEAIGGVLEDKDTPKIAHNGMYDIEFLEFSLGILCRGYNFDTMYAWHVLQPELPMSLAFITSIYTSQPYYKYLIASSSMDDYFHYNGLDACITYELHGRILGELVDDSLLDFYRDRVHMLVDPLLAIQRKGVAFDGEKRNDLRKRYRGEVEELQSKLDTEVGHPLNTGSNVQMCKWLYEELGFKQKTKKRKDTGQTTATADEEALEELYQETKNHTLKTVIDIRERNKLLSTYLEVKLDEDKRIRCSYNITGTETGRLSSSKTTRGTGTNLQNIPTGELRSLFTADKGHILLNADLSQAEARIVAYVADDSRLIRVFEDGGDIHRKNASNIFHKKEEEVTDEERQLAKRVVHASNYGMGPGTFAKTTGIPLARAKALLNQYFAAYPQIKNWHLATGDRLKRTRMLVTPFGRRRIFYNRWNDSLIKEGLAYVPQSMVADILNAGLRAFHSGYSLRWPTLLQVHDSILVECPIEDKHACKDALVSCLRIPITINKHTFTIPVDVKAGYNWLDMEKI